MAPERSRSGAEGGEPVQNPIRYYIVSDDDQPVVRSVPVAVRPTADVSERHEAAPSSTPNAAPARRPRRRPVRVARLVRAAIGRRGRVRAR